METTKQGKHGMLHLYEIAYTDRPERDDGQPYYQGALRSWGYSIEHVIERFYDSEDAEGWRVLNVARVPASGLMHCAVHHEVR